MTCVRLVQKRRIARAVEARILRMDGIMARMKRERTLWTTLRV